MSRKGFSLVEVLVLISVIFVIGLILYISFSEKDAEDTDDMVVATASPISQKELTMTPEPTATPAVTLLPTQVPVTIPTDWQEYTDTDSYYGLTTTLSVPQGYMFNFSGSEWSILNNDATDMWDYSTSVYDAGDGVKNHYDGGSRRVWYQKYLNREFGSTPLLTPVDIVQSATEFRIDNSSYLKVSVKYIGEMQTHYLYIQNGIVHIIRPVTEFANSGDSPIERNIAQVFTSISSEFPK